MAKTDYFLKLDGVVGESKDADHKGEIELESFSWGASNPASIGSAGSGAGAGKATFSDLNFMQRTQSSSPTLLAHVAEGGRIESGLLTARKAGKSGLEFLKIKLTDIFVTVFQISGSEGGLPVESVSLSFAKFEVSYTPQDTTGKAVSPVETGWNRVENKSV
jgi:type VI secretion system secreted protein Hcp